MQLYKSKFQKSAVIKIAVTQINSKYINHSRTIPFILTIIWIIET
jgi:ABC-type methionine transport system permease subunit